MDNNNWEMHQQQQQQARQQQYRSQSVSIPSAQYSSQQQYSQADYGQHNYDRRYPIQPLQVNPSSLSQPDVPMNLPSSSLPGSQPQASRERHRAQSTMMPAGREYGYASSSYQRMPAQRSSTGPGPSYHPEATVPISRHHAHPPGQWGAYPPTDLHPPPVEPRVPHISSVRSAHYHPVSLPPLSEARPEEAQPKPKPHVCDQCGAAFSRAHDLKRHIETHKGDRPHKCPTCTKAFSRKDALQRHQSMAQCGVDPQEMYQQQ